MSVLCWLVIFAIIYAVRHPLLVPVSDTLAIALIVIAAVVIFRGRERW